MEKLLSTVYDPQKKRKSFLPLNNNPPEKTDDLLSVKNNLTEIIQNELHPEAYTFISENVDLRNYPNILFTTAEKASVENLDFDNIRVMINTKEINNIRNINSHFNSVNRLLPDAGLYIGRVETLWERKIRLFNKVGKHLGQFIWILDFLINRIIPKFKYINKVYYFFTNNKNHLFSKAEILGRLVYNGFEIIDYKIIDGLFYFIAMKVKEPSNNPNPTYHPLIKLQRIGKGGKLIGIYKMRTMFAYSEYLQDYVVKLNGYNQFGKPANDFRVTRWGKIFRKYWIDELPQLINLLKGDIRIVGVRPLSKARFKELPENIQNERIKYKPGLIPPYVSLNMPDDKGNVVAERFYMKLKKNHPFITDIQFFFMAIYNILSGKIRSA